MGPSVMEDERQSQSDGTRGGHKSDLGPPRVPSDLFGRKVEFSRHETSQIQRKIASKMSLHGSFWRLEAILPSVRASWEPRLPPFCILGPARETAPQI